MLGSELLFDGLLSPSVDFVHRVSLLVENTIQHQQLVFFVHQHLGLVVGEGLSFASKSEINQWL